ncbi:MAG: glycine betaine ABC transporter substrate-binding protein [Firmicutes bacterium]|nr:glycine betaine ABC transporter substrate-binding protein [Bacillota bacterium]
MTLRWIVLAIVAAVVAAAVINFLPDQAPGQASLVRIAMPPWTTSPPPTYVAKAMLEDLYGLSVAIEETDVGVAWQSVANGDIDLLVDAWLPNLHANYLEAHRDNVEILGEPLYQGADLGWAVPAYVPADSVEDLKDESIAAMCNRRVIGIDPGAGMMRVSQQVLEAYDLDWELVEGSEFAMLTALDDAVRNRECIVFLAWRPHFMFAQHDLKFLEDPLGLWTRDNAVKVARRGFSEDFPGPARLLGRWRLPIEDVEQMINEIEVNGRPPEEVAGEWVAANRDRIRAWQEAD